jgi:anti-sigma regulatory factor (Ser/Thr protein kinase)
MDPEPKSSAAPGFRIALPSAPENVAVVRQALAGAGGVVGLSEARLLDVNAAVSEACNNVVVHAYPDAVGTMEVRLRVQPETLEVIVGDQGVGIRPHRPATELELEGLGLSLIQTLTDRVELLGGAGEGTKVQMAFHLEEDLPLSWMPPTPSDQIDCASPPGELKIEISGGPLAAPVLGRVIAMLASRAGFTLENISDAQLVTDSLAARIPGVSPGGKVRLGVDLPQSELLIKVGPLPEGGAQELLGDPALDGLPPVLQRLTRGRQVERDVNGEILGLALVNPQ